MWSDPAVWWSSGSRGSEQAAMVGGACGARGLSGGGAVEGAFGSRGGDRWWRARSVRGVVVGAGGVVSVGLTGPERAVALCLSWSVPAAVWWLAREWWGLEWWSRASAWA